MKRSVGSRWGVILAGLFGLVCVVIVGTVSYWQYVNSVPAITPHLSPMPNPNGYLTAKRLMDRLDQIQRPPPPKTWPNGSREQLRAQLGPVRPVLDSVRAAFRDEWRVPPTMRMDELEGPSSDEFQEYARFFVAESLLADHQGDFDTAMHRSLDAAELGSRLARGVGPTHSLEPECDQLWLRQVERLVPRLPLTAVHAALARVRRIGSERPSLPAILDNERLHVRAEFATIFRWYEELSLSGKLEILRSLNGLSASGRDLSTWEMVQLAWTPRATMLAEMDDYYRRRIVESKKLFGQRTAVAPPEGLLWQILKPIPSLDVEWQWERVDTELALLETALAVRGHYLEHGRYPQRLSDIDRKWLPVTPRDAWGQPVAYRLASDSRPLIYSVGPDGVDDAGRPVNLHRISRTMRGDLVFGRQSRRAWP
jgi:hypothetical protein